MKNVRQSNINIHKDAWVVINLEHLAQNIQAIKKTIPQGKKMMAIVKADAYGHGAQMLAQTMLASGVDMFGVSSIDEGLDLRQVKIKAPILVVGAVPVWAVETAAQNDIAISIFNVAHLKACEEVYNRTGIKPKVHVKIDTGMNRIGVRAEEAIEFITEDELIEVTPKSIRLRKVVLDTPQRKRIAAQKRAALKEAGK